jgi:peptidoglycan/LPS O-acetylase OafA/YrhL
MDSVSAALSSPRDDSLDLLRGAAALYIVGYYHIQDVWGITPPGALAAWWARVALALFCFLSGYLLSGRNDIANLRDVGWFYRRRLLRIYPLYFLALVGYVELRLVEPALFWPGVFLVNTLLDRPVLTLWFVSMICLFYLVTPLYLWRPSLGKTTGLTVFFLALLVLVKAIFGGIDPRLLTNLTAFALGIACVQSPRLRAPFFQSKTVWRMFSLVVLASFTGFFWQVPPEDARGVHMVAELAWFVAALPGLFSGARGLAQWLPAVAIHFLATASFVLYLGHRLYYKIGEALWAAPSPEARQIYYLGVLLPVGLLLSYAVQRGYECLFTSERRLPRLFSR